MLNTRTYQKFRLYFILLTYISVFCACSDQSDSPDTSGEPQKPNISVNLDQAEQTFWLAQTQKVQAAISASHKLEADILDFLNSPNQNSIAIAQQSLAKMILRISELEAINLLNQTLPEVFINSSETLFRINAFPIQPGYLDRFGAYKYSGLVFDIGFNLSNESLIQQHGLTDSEEVVLGVFAIEFMLNGENNSRSPKDYIAVNKLDNQHLEQQLSNLGEVPNNRRRTLLSLQSKQLTKDLLSLKKIYEEPNSADKRRWSKVSSQQKISKVRASLNSGITRSLVSLSNLQALLDSQNTDDPLTDTQSVVENQSALDSTLDANENTKLGKKIEALSSMTVFLSDIEKRAIDQALLESSQKLQTTKLENQEEATQELQDIYELLKRSL